MKLSHWFINDKGKICKPAMSRNPERRGYSVLKGMSYDYKLHWKYVYVKKIN